MKYLLTALMAITLPALAANVSTTTNPFGTNGGFLMPAQAGFLLPVTK